MKLGFIEEVENIYSNSDKIHYLAHRAVEHESSTTPLRMVYDCSAKPNRSKPSLNECLHAGPNMINDLSSVLLKFRVGKWAATSDIKMHSFVWGYMKTIEMQLGFCGLLTL